MQRFWNPASIDPRTLAPGVSAKIVSGEKVMLSLVSLEPGASVPPHSHPHEQMGMLVSGSLELSIEGELRSLPGHGLYLIPGGASHSAKAGPEGALAIEAFSPPREEYRKSPAG